MTTPIDDWAISWIRALPQNFDWAITGDEAVCMATCSASNRQSMIMTIKNHLYMPDYQAMGDCRVCGHEQRNHGTLEK